MSAQPKASVIVLAWNGMAYLDACLSAVLAQGYPAFEVIVVDNGSTDGSADFVAQCYPQVQLIRNERNLGFAAGNNVGLRAATGDVLVLLNQDTVVRQGWLEALVDTFQDPSVGIAGCKALYPDGSIQHAGGFIYGPRAETDHIGRHEPDDGRFDQMRDADFVTGAALAISRTALKRVGLLDEGFYPAYYEDVDWCYTVREAGFRVVYVPVARLIHYESQMAQRESHEHKYALHRGRLRFVFKHWTLERLEGEFVPAERAWAAHLERTVELMAARRAYLSTVLALPDILAFRQSSEEEADALVGLLTDLRAAAMSGLADLQANRSLAPVPHEPPPLRHSSRAEPEAEREADQGEKQEIDQEADWPGARLPAKLEAGREIREPPFASRVPIVGGLIVALRRLWSSVAVRWYVRPLIQQQNIFNAQVVGYLKALQDRLGQHDYILARHGQALEQHGELIGWVSRRTDQLEQRSTEHGRLLQGQLRDVEENIREINELAERLAALTRALSTGHDEKT